MIAADTTPLGEKPGPVGQPGRSVGLVMLVRNEEAVIERCLTSVRPHIDYWTICDTGSTDGTPEIVSQALQGIPGALYRDEWVNFGRNRTLALKRAHGKSDYLLVVDADMTLQEVAPLPDLEADVYHLQVLDRGSFTYRLPALIRGNLNWRYEGVTHEALAGNDYPAKPAVPLDGWKLFHHHDGSRRPDKFIDDLALLHSRLAKHPEDARATFYLAQTCRDLGLVDKAIDLYRRRAAMGGWDEEVFYSLYQLGCLLCVHKGFLEGAPHLLAAARVRPTRNEPLRALAHAAASVADRIPFPKDDVLFIHGDSYTA